MRLLSVAFLFAILTATALAQVPRSRVSDVSSARVAEHDASQSQLGKVNFKVSCSGQAQAEFDRSLALLHHMTYPEALVGFRRVSQIDPDCAMAHWGVAMTLFQPLWPTRPTPVSLQLGWDEVQKAMGLNPPTQLERSFIRAAAEFFDPPTGRDYWQRIARWEQSQKQVYEAFPTNPEAAAFYALAHLATAPSNVVSRDHSDRAAAILLQIYAANPDHPGAMHYLVHANDVPGRERENLDITRKYAAVAPRNPHALHMPTHIFTRLGDWNAVAQGNLRAAEAALEHPAGERGQFVWDEFPHAIEYLVYAYLQQGRDDEARREVERLYSTDRLEPTFKTAFHLASTRARFALERHAWIDAARIEPNTPGSIDWTRFSWPAAIGWFARGIGAARTEQVQAAREASIHLHDLEETTRHSGEELFARNIRMLALELDAWIAYARKDIPTSLALMREAAALEGSTPKHAVTPGSTLPAHEQLGDLLLDAKQPASALEAFRRSLELYPKRFNSLLGAARAARALDDPDVAREFYRELLESTGPRATRSSLEEARTYAETSADGSPYRSP